MCNPGRQTCVVVFKLIYLCSLEAFSITYLFYLYVKKIRTYDIVEQLRLPKITPSMSGKPVQITLDTFQCSLRVSSTLMTGFLQNITCDQTPQAAVTP